MNILLFGEYSGLFNCLRDGLVENGHQVMMASDGNGSKNFPRDIDWYANPKYGRLKHIIELEKLYKQRDLLKGYDVVLLINPGIFSRYRFVIKPVFDFLFKHNDKVFLSGPGMTPAICKYWYETGEKYHNYVIGNMQDVPSLKNSVKPHAFDWEYELMERINGYIPIWYEYAQPFRNHPKMIRTVRIPINLSKLEYKPNTVQDKIVFFHGIPYKKNAKGTAIIMQAFEKMKEKYGDVAEFVAVGGLPYDEYLKLITKVNVIVDDANSYSVAMNGLFSLAKGKIVMGGAEPEGNRELGIEGVNPVINICPDVNQICSAMERLILQKDNFESMGKKGREFVEKYHDHREIANQYIEIFEKY